MPRILTAEDTRLSDIQKAEIETTTSILDLIKNVDENIFENSDKSKLIAALLNRISNDEDIIDSLNLHKLTKPEDDANSEDSESDNSGGEEPETSEDDFDFNM